MLRYQSLHFAMRWCLPVYWAAAQPSIVVSRLFWKASLILRKRGEHSEFLNKHVPFCFHHHHLCRNGWQLFELNADAIWDYWYELWSCIAIFRKGGVASKKQNSGGLEAHAKIPMLSFSKPSLSHLIQSDPI